MVPIPIGYTHDIVLLYWEAPLGATDYRRYVYIYYNNKKKKNKNKYK